MKAKPLVLPCTVDEIGRALEELWPKACAARGILWPNERSPAPMLDGHMGIGFSIRLFGPGNPSPEDSSKGYAALEDMLRAMEDMGFEVTRDGNESQPGRLVLGWSACRRAYDTDLIRICDLHAVHGARVERSARLHQERADRDRAAGASAPSN